MNDRLVKTLAAVGGYWLVAMFMGFLSLPVWAFALASALLVAVIIRHVTRLDLPAPEPAAAPRPSLRSMLQHGRLDPAGDGGPLRLPTQKSTSGAEEGGYGVSVLDRECRVLWSNAVSAAHFDISETDLGRPVQRICADDALRAYLEAQDFSEPLRLQTLRCGGKALAVWVVPYLEEQWLLLSIDAAQAAHADSLRRDRIADALHELCTPITLLAGNIDRAQALEAEHTPVRNHLDAMERQCRRIHAIIEDLLNLATLETVAAPPSDSLIDMDALVSNVYAEASSLSAGRHRIVLDVTPGLNLYGAQSEVESALRNLAVNAVRYTPEGGEVRLVWRDAGAEAEFAVQDSGIGIAEEHIPRLTERFFRVNRDGCGTGLGLAIVHDVLARHQATLDVWSVLGRGSRFTARFPAARVARAPAPRLAPAEETAYQPMPYPEPSVDIGFADPGEGLPSRA